MANKLVPTVSVQGVTGVQGLGVTVERFTARFAFLLTAGAAGIPLALPLFNGQDANNTPAAGVNYQATKGVFRDGQIIQFNYVNVRNIATRLDYSGAAQNQVDLNNLGNCELQFDRQSDNNFLRFPVFKSWGYREHYQATTTVAASTPVFQFPYGAGYDVSQQGKYRESVFINTPTKGDATGNVEGPGIWLIPGPFGITFQAQRGITNLVANATLEVDLSGYLFITNRS